MAWVDDYAPSMGAAISYDTIFSLAPLLVIVIALAGAIFGRDAVQEQILGQIGGLVGRDGATAVQAMLKAASDTDKGLVAGLISVVVLVVGATTVFAERHSARWHLARAGNTARHSEFAKAPLDLGLAEGPFVCFPTDAPAKPAQLGGFRGHPRSRRRGHHQQPIARP